MEVIDDVRSLLTVGRSSQPPESNTKGAGLNNNNTQNDLHAQAEGRLSDEARHVAGLTAASLELINGSPGSVTVIQDSSGSLAVPGSAKTYHNLQNANEQISQDHTNPNPEGLLGKFDPGVLLINQDCGSELVDGDVGAVVVYESHPTNQDTLPPDPELTNLTNARISLTPIQQPSEYLTQHEDISRNKIQVDVSDVIVNDANTRSLVDLVTMNLRDTHPQVDPELAAGSSAFLTPIHSDQPSPNLKPCYTYRDQQQSASDDAQDAAFFKKDPRTTMEHFEGMDDEHSQINTADIASEQLVTLNPKPLATRGRKRKLKVQSDDSGSAETEKPLGAGNKAHREVLVRPLPHVLPPCKVCGIQATGFHYGVNTCEACKGFFRRSIIRKNPYVCANNAVKCAIAPGKRNTCPACRYKKCTEAGMSVEGIKIGRYTYAKRTQDILELQDPVLSTAIPGSSPGSPPAVVPLIAATPAASEEEPREGQADSDDSALGQSPAHSGTSQSDLSEFIDTVLMANEKYPESLKNTDFVEKIQSQIKEQKEKNPDGNNPMTTKVPMEQFLSVLNTTGVQLDDRFQILQQWLSLLNDSLRYVIIFAKELPGFKELSMADQMALIKHSICEVFVIGRHRAFHVDYDLFTTRSGLTIDVPKALGEVLGHRIMSISRRIRSLGLTSEEIIILKAMVIFFTDRCELEEPDRVAAIHERLLLSLLYLLERRGANTASMVGRLSGILTDLRPMTESYQQYTQKLRIISSNTGAVEFPPLFLEVITLT